MHHPKASPAEIHPSDAAGLLNEMRFVSGRLRAAGHDERGLRLLPPPKGHRFLDPLVRFQGAKHQHEALAAQAERTTRFSSRQRRTHAPGKIAMRDHADALRGHSEALHDLRLGCRRMRDDDPRLMKAGPRIALFKASAAAIVRMQIVRGDDQCAPPSGERQVQRIPRESQPVPAIVLDGIIRLRPMQMEHLAGLRCRRGSHQPRQRQSTFVVSQELDLDSLCPKRLREQPLIRHSLAPIRGEKHLHSASNTLPSRSNPSP